MYSLFILSAFSISPQRMHRLEHPPVLQARVFEIPFRRYEPAMTRQDKLITD